MPSFIIDTVVAEGVEPCLCPIKALVNEKFLALCRAFGPESVGPGPLSDGDYHF